MDISKQEMKAVQVAIDDKKTGDLQELEALELALVGGGCGDVQF